MRINKLLYLHSYVKSLSAWAVGIIKASRINCLDRQIVWRCKEWGSDRLAERERERERDRGEKGERKRERKRGRENDEDQGSSRRQHWRTCCSITTQFSTKFYLAVKSRPTIIITMVILSRRFYIISIISKWKSACITLVNEKIVFNF